MDEVASGLYVGSLADAGDTALLQENSINRIVSVTYGDPETGYPDSATVSQYPMMDGPRNEREVFAKAVEQVLMGLDQNETILVHCSRGASRSPSIAATAVALHKEIGIEEAFEQIGERRNNFDSHPAVVRQAVNVYRDYSV